MHYLLAGIVALIVGIMEFMARRIVRRLAVIALVVSGLAGFLIVFVNVVDGLIGQLSAITPPHFDMAVSMVVPANLVLCVTLLITGRIARWVYEWNAKIIQFRLF